MAVFYILHSWICIHHIEVVLLQLRKGDSSIYWRNLPREFYNYNYYFGQQYIAFSTLQSDGKLFPTLQNLHNFYLYFALINGSSTSRVIECHSQKISRNCDRTFGNNDNICGFVIVYRHPWHDNTVLYIYTYKLIMFLRGQDDCTSLTCVLAAPCLLLESCIGAIYKDVSEHARWQCEIFVYFVITRYMY